MHARPCRVRKIQIEAYEKQQEEANRKNSAIYFTDVDEDDDNDRNSNNNDSSSSSNSNSGSSSNIKSKHTSDIENRVKPSRPPQNNNNDNSSSNGNSNGKYSSSDNSKQLKPSFNHLLGLNGGGRYMPSSSMRDRGRRG